MKRQFKQWKTTILPISTKWTTTSHLKRFNTNKISSLLETDTNMQQTKCMYFKNPISKCSSYMLYISVCIQGWAVKTTPVLTVAVNTIILSERLSILFFFISKMMNIFIWSPNLNFYCCINLLNILKHHWITIEIYLRHIFRFSGAVLNTFIIT